jgi:O-antigen/teichoic acid export membrane protein
MHPILKGVIARSASLVPAALATLLASRLVLAHYNIGVFNAYSLVFTTMVLIPLNDLGAGAALTAAIASDGIDHPHTRQVALTAARVLMVSGLALIAGALLLSALGLWGDVLGGGAYATGAFGIAIAAYGLSFVPGLGQSALLGANKNDLTIIVQAFLAPAMALGAALCIVFDLDARWVVIVPGVAVFVISLINAWVSARVTHLRLLPLMPKLAFLRRHKGARIRGIAGPALILTLTSPITLQGDRLVLSHFSTAQAVADYTVTVQIFAPLVALIAAAARPLWPMFARARATGTGTVGVGKVVSLFVVLTGACSAVLFVIAGPVAHVIGGNQIHLGIALPLAMAVGVTIQAAAVPLSMVLMYPAGLRFIATISLIATPLNLGASILVAPSLGAPGPLYVSIVVALLLQTIPAMVYLRRHGHGVTPDGVDMAPFPPSEEQSVMVDSSLSVVAGGPAPAWPTVEPHDRPSHDAWDLAVFRPAPDELAPPASPLRAPSPVLADDRADGHLEAVVTAAVEQALANTMVHLDLDPTILPGQPVGILDGVRQVVARIDRQSAQLDEVARRVEDLRGAMDEFTEASRALADHQLELDPPERDWPGVLQGDEDVLASADELRQAVRDRRRRPRRR